MKPLPIARNIVEWLSDPADILGIYYTKAQQLKALNALWQQHMEISLKQHTAIANFTETQLVIEVNNSAWATRMHYLTPDILHRVKQWPSLSLIQAIKWYIKPQNEPYGAQPHQMRIPQLSQHNKQLLDSTAQTVTSPELKQALFNLSRVHSADK